MRGGAKGGWVRRDAVGSSTGLMVWDKTADGDEGATITITSESSSQVAAHVYRLSGHDPVEVTEVSEEVLTDDPPSLTPSWGNATVLWLPFVSDIDTNVTGAPTNYTNLIADSANLFGSARRILEASSEDPDAFTTGSGPWKSRTVAVKEGTGPITVDGVATTNITGSDTSHELNMPTGIVAGDLLVVELFTTATVTFP